MAAKKIKKILVPLDGSKNSIRGLDKAIVMAKQFGGSITAIHALPTAPIISRKSVREIERKYLAQANQFISDAKNKVTKTGISFNSKVRGWQHPGSFIIDFAKNNNFDLIVIGSRGRGSAKEFFLGSTSNYVVHKSKIPVLVVP